MKNSETGQPLSEHHSLSIAGNALLKPRFRYFASAVLTLFVLALSACGGGGGGGGSDTTPPVVTAPVDIIVEAVNASGTAATDAALTTFLADSTAVDVIDDTNLTFSHNAPTTFPLGATVVTFSHTDTSGNTGTATATVTVSDTVTPVVTAPADISVEAPGTAAIANFLAGSTSTDAVDPAPVVTTNAPTTFPLGATVVTFSHTDTSGNTGTATATVTVSDTVAPVVTTPADITVEADSAAGTAASNGTIAAFLAASTSTDAVDASPTVTTDAPTTLPLGATVVTFTHTDTSGNTGTATASVTVNDTIAPVITLTGANPPTVDLHSTFIDPGSSVFDAVSTGLTATVTGSVDTSIVGANILSYDVIDGAGNVATTVTRTVNVEVATPSNVALTVAPKHLNFTWDASTAQDKFRLLENPDGSSGFSVIAEASNIATGATGYSLEIPVHLTDWANAEYLIEACNTSETQCKSTSSLVNTQPDSNQAITTLMSSNLDPSDFFGQAVDISDDGLTIAIGAYQESSNATGVNGDQDDNSLQSSGAVYVFVKTGTTWVQEAYLKTSVSTTINGDSFGWDVSLSSDGNTLAVGAPGAFSDSGVVSVFTRTGSSWSQQADLVPSNLFPGYGFGHSIAMSDDGNTLAVGTPGDNSTGTGVDGAQNNNNAGNFTTGAAYIFTRTGASWSQQTYIKAPVFSRAGLGSSIALSSDGNTLAVGAISEDSQTTGIGGTQGLTGAENSGAVYILSRIGITWTHQEYIKASNTEAFDVFGFSLALSGDGNTLAVGANAEKSNATSIGGNESNNDAHLAGATYVFHRIGASWSQQAYIKASDAASPEQFGESVALNLDGNRLVVTSRTNRGGSAGGVNSDPEGNSNTSGAAYLFTRNSGIWSQSAYLKSPVDQLEGAFVSTAFDAVGDSLVIGRVVGGDSGDVAFLY